jgi:hypothetical protein
MDFDAAHPRCPFCSTPMQFKRTSPNYGAHDPLQTFECLPCQAVLDVPLAAERFELAAL